MDATKLQKFVEETLPELRHALALNNWNFDIDYDADRGDTPGETASCQADPRYEDAYINLRPHKIKDADDAWVVLLHEVLHVLHSDTRLVNEIVGQYLTGDDYDAFQAALHWANERTVRNIEKFIKLGLGLDTKEKLLRVAQQAEE